MWPSGVEFERWVASGSRLLPSDRPCHLIKRLPSRRWATRSGKRLFAHFKPTSRNAPSEKSMAPASSSLPNETKVTSRLARISIRLRTRKFMR